MGASSSSSKSIFNPYAVPSHLKDSTLSYPLDDGMHAKKELAKVWLLNELMKKTKPKSILSREDFDFGAEMHEKCASEIKSQHFFSLGFCLNNKKNEKMIASINTLIGNVPKWVSPDMRSFLNSTPKTLLTFNTDPMDMYTMLSLQAAGEEVNEILTSLMVYFDESSAPKTPLWKLEYKYNDKTGVSHNPLTQEAVEDLLKTGRQWRKRGYFFATRSVRKSKGVKGGKAKRSARKSKGVKKTKGKRSARKSKSGKSVKRTRSLLKKL